MQIAKSLGADITGVCSGANVGMVRSLGADPVIDYTQENFTQGETSYDVIFDNVKNRELAVVRRALARRARWFSITAPEPVDWRCMCA